MNTAIVPNPAPGETFEERMKKRIKESIGDLMSDEDLKKIIEKGINDTFFTTRSNPKKSSWNNEPNTLPPLINEIVKEVLEDQIKKQVALLLEERKDEVMIIVKSILEKGAGDLLLKSITSTFEIPLMNLQSSIQATLTSNNLAR